MSSKCKANDNGDCQHVRLDGRLRIIPSGTHIIGGRTVFAASSSGSAATSRQKDAPQSVKQEADNLAMDLLDIINKNLRFIYIPREMRVSLLQDLCIYIVERDTKVMIHGYNVGKGGEV